VVGKVVFARRQQIDVARQAEMLKAVVQDVDRRAEPIFGEKT
jgi:hypothetical protein